MEDRLTNLEIKIAFVEKHLTDLDELVRTMHVTLERMQFQIASLAEVLDAGEGEGGGLMDEKPPHY